MSSSQESFQFPQTIVDAPNLLLGPFTNETGTAFQVLWPGAQKEIVVNLKVDLEQFRSFSQELAGEGE